MIALNYFLYDNRTTVSRRTDWGIKAATGELAGRGDLRANFRRYCDALGEQGHLAGFEAAIGGVGPRGTQGYLLCVTLETSDLQRRPSWAVFGLWCPDVLTLNDVLTAGDPVGSARGLLGRDTPADAITILPASGTIRPRRLREPAPEFHRFEARSTVHEVISILLGAIRIGSRLPNILGVTASSRLPALTQAGFDLVYCLPMDAQTERSLLRQLSPEREVKDWLYPVEPSSGISPERTLVRQDKRAKLGSPTFLTCLILLLLGTLALERFPAAGWLQLGNRLVGMINRHDATLTANAMTPAIAHKTHAKSVPQDASTAALDDIRARLEEFRKLSPDDLRRGSSFLDAYNEKLQFDPSYLVKRARVKEAFSSLLEIRGRMVKRRVGNYVAYFYDEQGASNRDAGSRLQGIRAILNERPLGRGDCRVLKEAFGYDYEQYDSEVHRWCNAVERLESVVASRRLDVQTTPGKDG